MARAPSTFRQRDVSRALRAAASAGMTVDRVEIDRAGKIVIVARNADYSSDASGNEWDVAPAKEARQ
jgi:hypothetical protein